MTSLSSVALLTVARSVPPNLLGSRYEVAMPPDRPPGYPYDLESLALIHPSRPSRALDRRDTPVRPSAPGRRTRAARPPAAARTGPAPVPRRSCGSSATLMKSRIAVPVQLTSTRGAPRPASRSGDVDGPEVDAVPGPPGSVRDGGVQLGAGEQQHLAGAGSTISSWSGCGRSRRAGPGSPC